jgi:hypothetical protein
MLSQTLLGVLTAANLGLLGYQSVQSHQRVSSRAAVPDVIQARALKIVDERGRVRASLEVLPENPKVIWKGKPYPETVLLRLINEEGRPNVKLGASKMGAALVIGGESDPTHVQVLAEGGETTVKLSNKDGQQRIIQP